MLDDDRKVVTPAVSTFRFIYAILMTLLIAAILYMIWFTGLVDAAYYCHPLNDSWYVNDTLEHNVSITWLGNWTCDLVPSAKPYIALIPYV